MSDTTETQKVIDLRKPLQTPGGQTVDQLHLRVPRIGERRKAEGHYRNGISPESATRYNISIVASVSGVNESVIEMMDVDQLEEAANFLEGFSDRGRKTGST